MLFLTNMWVNPDDYDFGMHRKFTYKRVILTVASPRLGTTHSNSAVPPTITDTKGRGELNLSDERVTMSKTDIQ